MTMTLAVLLAFVATLAPVCSFAATLESLAGGQVGGFTFRSVTPAGVLPPDAEALRRAPPAQVAATLLLPKTPKGAKVAEPFPAMVVLHGSGGPGPRDQKWAEWLRDQGVAALVLDSFSMRRVQETVTDQFRLSVWVGAVDALRALELLSGHPQIDPARIGVMGFSRGGMSALQTALEPVRRRFRLSIRPRPAGLRRASRPTWPFPPSAPPGRSRRPFRLP